jgi:hypothetical protein
VFKGLTKMHANRMRSIILPSVACPALKYFSTLSHKRHGFRGGGVGNIEHKVRDLISSTTFVRNVSHFMKNSATYRECTLVFLYSTCCSCEIGIELELSTFFLILKY